MGGRRRKRRCADVSSLLCAHTHWQGEFVCLSSKEQPPELARRCNRMLPRRLFSKQGFPDGSRRQTHPGVCGARNETLKSSSRSLKSASLMIDRTNSKRGTNWKRWKCFISCTENTLGTQKAFPPLLLYFIRVGYDTGVHSRTCAMVGAQRPGRRNLSQSAACWPFWA